MNTLVQDNAPLGMTPLEWCQAQATHPAINQIVGEFKREIKEIKNPDGDAFRIEGAHQNEKAINIEARGPL